MREKFNPLSKQTALLVGATGLVGNMCLEYLVASGLYGNIIVITRKPLFPKLLGVTNLISDFSNLDEIASQLKADHVYCALGTTIKKAGSQQAFRKVDFDYPFQIARITKKNGAKKFMLISSIGADAHSPIFYIRVKGELEAELEKMDFESLVIVQPSFLLGKRSEFRLGEFVGKKIASAFSFAFVGILKPYKGIDASIVAKSLIVFANKRNKKLIRATYDEMEKSLNDFGKW